MRWWFHWFGQIMLVSGLVVLSYPVASWIYSDGFQVYQGWSFDRSRMQSREPLVESPPILHTVIGRIEIPRLGLAAMIVEGVEDKDLLLGAGHVPGTAFPGEPGNVVIGGHRDSYFRPLRAIRRNDIIILTTLHSAHRYVVTSTEVTEPTDTSVLSMGSEPILTLISCYPFSYVGPAPERFVVRASRLEAPKP